MNESIATSARRQATRERLLAAAAEVFVEEGLQGASVKAICQRAGFTRGAFYSNFTSKEELFLALLEREFAERAVELARKTEELSPLLRESAGTIDPARAAVYIADFLSLGTDAPTWYALETEFSLLAMRDPAIAPKYAEFLVSSYESISAAVEVAVEMAGRRFTMPAAHAVQILGGEFERALRITTLGGGASDGGLDQLAPRISEVLFAITEPFAPPE